jgi:hypothetical protein
MTAPSTVCPACGEDVPFGRRTCEACGANVTVIAAPTDATGDEAPDGADVVDAAGDATTDDEVWDAAPSAANAPTTMPAPPVPGKPEPGKPAPVEPEPKPFVPPVLREWNPGSVDPETDYAARLAAAQADPAGLAGAWLPPSSPTARASTPDATAEPASFDWPAAEPESHAATQPGTTSTASNTIPASLSEMLQRTSTGTPRWPGATGSGVSDLESQTTSIRDTDDAMVPPSRMPDLGPATRPSSAMPPEPRRIEPGRSPLFADLPFDAPNSLPGWLVAGGGGLATISFLLPWVAVIDSYFSAWGLGSISNLPAFLLVFGTTALAILPSRLADWLRHGILGLTVGSFILGITWNRLVGATGGQLGVILEATGALLLLIGGILAIVRDRGAADGPRERG